MRPSEQLLELLLHMLGVQPRVEEGEVVGGLCGTLHLSTSPLPSQRKALTKSDFEWVTFVGKLGWDHALF